MYMPSNWSSVSSVFGGPCWWKTSNFMKLVLISHTAFSLWVYITCLHEGTLPPQLISLETLHFQKMRVLFFTSADRAVWPHLKAMVAQKNDFLHDRLRDHEATFQPLFSASLCGRVDMSHCCFVTTTMTNLHHITLKRRPFRSSKEDTCQATLCIRLFLDVLSSFTAKKFFLPFNHLILLLQSHFSIKKRY